MEIIIKLCFHDKCNYKTILTENVRLVQLTQNGDSQAYCNLLIIIKQIYFIKTRKEIWLEHRHRGTQKVKQNLDGPVIEADHPRVVMTLIKVITSGSSLRDVTLKPSRDIIVNTPTYIVFFWDCLLLFEITFNPSTIGGWYAIVNAWITLIYSLISFEEATL